MLVSHALEDTINGLDDNDCALAWYCVDDIFAALDKAGPGALLALHYCSEVKAEDMAALVFTQEDQISRLTTAYADALRDRAVAVKETNELKAKAHKLAKKAKKKSKK